MKEILNESVSSEVYHFTTLEGLKGILSSNSFFLRNSYIAKNDKSLQPNMYPYYLSLTNQYSSRNGYPRFKNVGAINSSEVGNIVNEDIDETLHSGTMENFYKLFPNISQDDIKKGIELYKEKLGVTLTPNQLLEKLKRFEKGEKKFYDALKNAIKNPSKKGRPKKQVQNKKIEPELEFPKDDEPIINKDDNSKNSDIQHNDSENNLINQNVNSPENQDQDDEKNLASKYKLKSNFEAFKIVKNQYGNIIEVYHRNDENNFWEPYSISKLQSLGKPDKVYETDIENVYWFIYDNDRNYNINQIYANNQTEERIFSKSQSIENADKYIKRIDILIPANIFLHSKGMLGTVNEGLEHINLESLIVRLCIDGELINQKYKGGPVDYLRNLYYETMPKKSKLKTTKKKFKIKEEKNIRISSIYNIWSILKSIFQIKFIDKKSGKIIKWRNNDNLFRIYTDESSFNNKYAKEGSFYTISKIVGLLKNNGYLKKRLKTGIFNYKKSENISFSDIETISKTIYWVSMLNCESKDNFDSYISIADNYFGNLPEYYEPKYYASNVDISDEIFNCFDYCEKDLSFLKDIKKYFYYAYVQLYDKHPELWNIVDKIVMNCLNSFMRKNKISNDNDIFKIARKEILSIINRENLIKESVFMALSKILL